MSEAKFTKGPWVARRNSTYWEIIRHDDGGFYDGGIGDVCATEVSSHEDIREPAQRANAHLIAAAPDLYNALETLTTYCEIKGIPTDAAYAALAKARGES